jgi:hypothetical protein
MSGTDVEPVPCRRCGTPVFPNVGWCKDCDLIERLTAENRELRHEARGLTADGRTVPDLEAEVERLTVENRDLHHAFECERCGHNVRHPDGTRCSIPPDEGDEFCTFLVCGRCVNEQHARARRTRADLDRMLTRCDEARERVIRERDRLRARVSELEDGIRDHRDVATRIYRPPLKFDRELWALLDTTEDHDG